MEQLGTTHLLNDTSVISSSRVERTDVLAPLYKSVSQMGSQDIANFLAKPFRLKSGSFATTDSTVLDLFRLPHDLWTSGNNPVAYYKLLGVNLIKADIVITLVVNAVRFQQGRYILAFCPTGGYSIDTPNATAFYRAHACNLMQVSQLPNVQIDLATQTTAQIVIPYSSAFTHYKYNTTDSTRSPSAGFLWIQPMAALVAGSGPSTCPYTLWASIENPVFSGATIAQSGFKITKKPIIKGEQEASGVGPISGPLHRLSTATGILSEIPLLSSVTAPVSWVADVLARSAKAMGLSKPLVLNPPQRVARNALAYIASADGGSNAVPISLASTNEVVVHSGVSATNVDEMSIDFIKSQYAYYSTTSWSGSAVAGDQLMSLGCNPFNYYQATSIYYTFAPVTMLARNFRYWRGGLKFRFKLVKTEFHSGRLVVAFLPWDRKVTGAPTVTLANTDYLVREIVDIRTTSEFEVCVPYVSTDLYQQSSFDNIPGYLYVFVLDALVAPSSVSSSISIITEVAGAPDLEFAVPGGEDWDVFVPPVVQSGFSVFQCEDLGADSSTIVPSTVAIGEKVTSIRQVLKKVAFNKPVSTLPTPAAGESLKIFPFMLHATNQFGSAAGIIYRGAYFTDCFTKWSMCYAMASGSVRLVVNPTGNSSKFLDVFMDVDPATATPSDVSVYNSTDVARDAFYVPVNTDIDGYAHVQVPAYNRLIARPTPSLLTNQTVVGAWAAGNPSANLGANFLQVTVRASDYTASSQDAFKWCRSVGDDFNLSYWCGTVPMLSPTVHIP